MDRDKRWERLEIAWKMLTRGEGKLVDDLAAAVEAGYSGAGQRRRQGADRRVREAARCVRGPDGKRAGDASRDGDACFF